MKHFRINKQTAFLLLGCAIGVFCGCVSQKGISNLDTYINMQRLLHIGYLKMEHINYVLYLLRLRGLVAIVLLICAMSYVGKYILSMFLTFIGIGIGLIGVCFALEYQVEGVGVFLAFLFPQILFYIPALYEYYDLLICVHDNLFQSKNIITTCSKRKPIGRQIGKIFGVTIMGILSECYVNPIFIKIMVKIL